MEHVLRVVFGFQIGQSLGVGGRVAPARSDVDRKLRLAVRVGGLHGGDVAHRAATPDSPEQFRVLVDAGGEDTM
jgi:hypothetical protein